MKNNKMFIYLFVFMFGLLFIGIDGVYASSATCIYKFSNEMGTLTITANDSTVKCNVTSTTPGNLAGVCPSVNIQNMKDSSGNLKCPEKLYGYTSSGGRTVTYYFSLKKSDTYNNVYAVLSPDSKVLNDSSSNKEPNSASGNYTTCTYGSYSFKFNSEGTFVLLNSPSDTTVSSTKSVQDFIKANGYKCPNYIIPSCVNYNGKTCGISGSHSNGAGAIALNSGTENADEIVDKNNGKQSGLGYDEGDGQGPYTCEGLLDEDLKKVLEWVLKVIQIGGPILLIILTAVDFGQVVISNDQDALKKAVSKIVKRAIAALALFFVPFLVSLILNMEGISDWTSDDPNCGISMLDN
ncbi:MAG: hypothetical protein ACI4OG_03980 [Bacilli bacterium]